MFFFGFLKNNDNEVGCIFLLIGILYLFKWISKLVKLLIWGSLIVIWNSFVLDIKGLCLFCNLISVMIWLFWFILYCIDVNVLFIIFNFNMFL